MTDEELLEFFYGMPNSCMDDDIERCDDYEDCHTCWRAWLGEEAKETNASTNKNTNENKEGYFK